VYEQPYGGVASDADASDIAPNEFAVGDGVFIKNGRILSAGWGNSTTYNFSDVVGKGYFSGSETSYGNITFVLLVKKNNGAWVTVALDNAGRAYYYDPFSKHFVLDQQLPAATMNSISCLQVIAGVVYVFDYVAGAIYVYVPLTSYTVGSTFVGGQFCMVLDNYLITANTNQPTDSPAVKENRYNWCAPFAYTTWDPAIDRTAGFNTLSSASDSITGCFAMGNVGYILRNEGLTQLTPTGIALSPFDVTSVWDSLFGIGCTYPDTFAQYGSFAIWGNTNNFYAFYSGNVPEGITGSAKVAIYADINKYESDPLTNVETLVSGAFSNTSENSILPELTYTLCITHQNSLDPAFAQAIIWTYNVANKAWTRQFFDLAAIIQQLAGIAAVNIGSLQPGKVIGLLQPNKIGLLTALPPRRIAANLLVSFAVGLNNYSFMFAFYYNETGTNTLTGTAQIGLNVIYREEEMRLGTKPTVRGVIVKAAGTGTLKVLVNDEEFSDIAVNSSSASVYRSFGVLSEENPQLTLSSVDFDGYVVKSTMDITYDEGDPL
jgi:hypothetical protein